MSARKPRIVARDLRLEYRDETRGEQFVAVDGLTLDVLADEFLLRRRAQRLRKIDADFRYRRVPQAARRNS